MKTNVVVQCYGSPFSDHMGTCIGECGANWPMPYDAYHTEFKTSEPTISLLNDKGTEYEGMTVVNIQKQVEEVWQIVDQMYRAKRKSSLACDVWIEEKVLFFMAYRFHVYVRMLDYFNLHKVRKTFETFFLANQQFLCISGIDKDHFP